MSCCGSGTGAGSSGAATTSGLGQDSSITLESVKTYYGKVLSTSKDLKTSACTAAGRPGRVVREAMGLVPDEVMAKFYGCGVPLPLGIEGLSVLDLGSGSGRDAYVAAVLVGPSGSVVGVDMTDEQLAVANSNIPQFVEKLGYEPKLTFKKGFIELLADAGVAPESVDVAISNCVVNLSCDKPAVLRGVFAALKPGGEFYFSDIYCDRRLPKAVREHEVLWGECVAGAMYRTDFERLCRDIGFTDPRVLTQEEVVIEDDTLKDVVGRARFYSITYRLFKLPGQLETECEDYGQIATYKGTIPGHPHAYELDDHHTFETGKPELVCGNTAAMVGEDGVSWLARHFNVVGDRSTHYGLFPCGDTSAVQKPSASSAPAASSGGCC